MDTLRLFVAAVACLTVMAGCSCDDAAQNEDITPKMGITGPAPGVTTIDGGLAIAFGDVLVGQSSQVTLSITNSGTFRLEITAITADTGTPPSFSYSAGSLPIKLDPQRSTSMSFAYAPAKPGAESGAFVLTTNDPAAKSFRIAVSGRGVQPDIEVCTPETTQCNDDNKTQLAIDFGQVQLGQAAGPHKVTIKDAGLYPLTVTEAVVLTCPWDKPDCAFADMVAPTIAEFDLAPATIAGTYAGGAGIDVDVTYRPAQGGITRSALRIVSNDGDELEVWVLFTGTGIAPRICPNPPVTVDFGSVTIGSSLTKEFTFSSCGTEVLQITNLAFEAGVTPEFSFAEPPQATPFDLPPGQTVLLKLTYSPTNEGADTGRIEIASTDPNSPKGYVILTGNGTKAPTCDMLVSPTTLDFGSVPTGGGFSSKVIDVQNIGDLECSVTEIRGPTGSAAFTIPVPPTFPVAVPPGGVMSFAVQYKPPKEGADTATVVVVSPTDPGRPEETVTLNGKGIKAPPCSFQADPGLLTFGSIAMGVKKAMKTKIYNFGTADDCQVASWSIAPGSDRSYTVSKLTFPPPTILPGKFLEATVTFLPQKAGPLTGKLEVRGGQNPIIPTEKVSVSLNGTGMASAMCINPTKLDYGTVTLGGSKDLSFEVSSCGAGTLNVRSISFDTTPPVFTWVTAPAAPLTLAAGQKATFTVRYKPTGNTPDFGRILVLSNAPATPTGIVELRGNYPGACPSVLQCWPSSLNFGQVYLGRSQGLTFTCTSYGSDPLTIQSVAAQAGTSAEFKVATKPTPLTLNPGEQLTVAVGYTPADVGVDTGYVTVTSKFTSAECNAFVNIDVKVTGEGLLPSYPKCIQPRQFTPTLKWDWPNGTISNPTFKNVFMTPIVINLTDDNGDGRVDENDIPDVIFNAFAGMALGVDEPSMVRAISGDDGHDLWAAADPKFRTNFETQLAAADINGDNLPEILASKLVITDTGSATDPTGKFVTGNILAFRNDGTFLWESEPWHGPKNDIEDGSPIGIADLDHDGKPEIFRGSSVFDNTGKLLWEGGPGHGTTYHGNFAMAVDLDGTGNMELLAGNTAYRADGTTYWKSPVEDGSMGVADFNGDGKPEVIIFPNTGSPSILNGQTGAVLSQLPKSSTITAIMPPVIADIDGDGVPEIGVVGTCSDAGSQTSQECFWGIAVDKSTLAMTEIWREVLNDGTLGGGATAFDFEGDGPFEMLQNDEQWVNVYSGRAHTQIYHAPRRSVTGWELPIVVDVDNDGHAEIVLKQDGDYKGILVYGNVDNDWVATRRIWNQFFYTITNINENGTVPLFEVPNWTIYNNMLANQPFCKK